MKKTQFFILFINNFLTENMLYLKYYIIKNKNIILTCIRHTY